MKKLLNLKMMLRSCVIISKTNRSGSSPERSQGELFRTPSSEDEFQSLDSWIKQSGFLEVERTINDWFHNDHRKQKKTKPPESKDPDRAKKPKKSGRETRRTRLKVQLTSLQLRLMKMGTVDEKSDKIIPIKYAVKKKKIKHMINLMSHLNIR